MKRAQKPISVNQPDTPATRKKRLQARLRELNFQGEQEMTSIMKTVDQAKAAFRKKSQRSKPDKEQPQ